MIGKIIAAAGLIAVLGFIPLNIEGSTGLDELRKELHELRQDLQQQKCEEQTGNITGCATERYNQDAGDFMRELAGLD